MRKLWVIPVVLVVAGLVWALWPRGPQPLQASLVAAAAPADSAGFARAEGPRPFRFPADDGPHNDYQTEWWYYTGNLTAPTGEHFGYQLTFFRRALTPPAGTGTPSPTRPSDWATDQVYLAHFALTDVAGGQHQSFERLERGAAGLAGAQADPYHVWLDNWSVRRGADGQETLQAAAEGITLTLTLRSLKPPVLQGDAGYSRKGSQPGNASYYYSRTRIESRGTVTTRGQSWAVTGLSWMDHEFSTSALEPGVVGWDWFSLQLNDGSELMLYALRRADGSVDPFSSGTLVAADGSTRHLGPSDFKEGVTGHWRSPRNGANYPAGWTLDIPTANLHLTIAPYLADQEMNVSYVYWEGASHAQGTIGGRAVAGDGYVELTGYAGSLGGRF
jgi:predicted secreted hydrolase